MATIKPFSFKLDADTVNVFKETCIEREETQSSVINKFMDDYINNKSLNQIHELKSKNSELEEQIKDVNNKFKDINSKLTAKNTVISKLKKAKSTIHKAIIVFIVGFFCILFYLVYSIYISVV